MSKKAYIRKDRFYEKAKRLGYKSRAAFKILELNKKFNLLDEGSHVLDLGCSPGSWLQVIAREIGPSGMVVGVDTEAIQPLPEKNIVFIRGDVREDRTKNQLLTVLGRKVDLVVSDLAPHLSGIKFQDHYNSYELAEQALKICQMILRENGNFLVKIFPGEELEHFKANLKCHFPRIQTFIPDSTRQSSTEIYIAAKGFHSQ